MVPTSRPATGAKPAAFDCFAPTGADEALSILSRHGEGARVLAGGQSSMPLTSFRMARPSAVVDLNGCADLFYLRRANGRIVCGAMTRQGVTERSPLVRNGCPLPAGQPVRDFFVDNVSMLTLDRF